MTISDVGNHLEAMLHGTTLNQIQNLYGLYNRAAMELMSDMDWQETKRIAQLTNPIYSQIYDYALPVDVKGNRIIDIRPQVNRTPQQNYSQQYGKNFDLQKAVTSFDNFAVQFNTGIKTVRIDNLDLPTGLVISTVDGLNDNGVWTATGSGSNIRINNVNFASGSSALNIDLALAGSTGGFVNSSLQQLDLTNYLNQGTLFTYVYLPTGSSFTSIALKWGSDASNYYTRTVTTTQENVAFQTGWNLLAFNWLGATKVGNPDVTKIDYVAVDYNYDGTAQTAVGLDNITCRMGQYMEIVYYSKYLFSSGTTGAWQETVLADTDIVNLDTDSFPLFLYQVAYLASQQIQGTDATFFDAPTFLNLYKENLATYQQLYRSEVSKPQQNYYKINRGGYDRFSGYRRNY